MGLSGGGSARITARAGHWMLQKILESIGLLERAKALLPHPGSGRGYTGDVFFATICHLLFGGGSSLSSVQALKDDGLFNGRHIPAANTLGSWLWRVGKFHMHVLNVLNRIVVGMAIPRALREALVIDVDDTAIITKTAQAMWMYNGKRGLMATVAFIAGLDLLLASRLRPGNRRPGSDMVAFMEACLASLPKGATVSFFRMDSAGYQLSVLEFCVLHNINFLIAARLDNAVRARADAVADADWRTMEDDDGSVLHIAETEHQFKNGGPKFRLILMRRNGDDHLPGLSGSRLAGALATKLPGDAEEIIRLYRKRGEAENRIKEWKSDTAAGLMPCRKKVANDAWVRITGIVYNLHILISRRLFPKARFRLKTVREKAMRIPGRVVSHSRKLVLRVTDADAKRLTHWLDKFVKRPHPA